MCCNRSSIDDRSRVSRRSMPAIQIVCLAAGDSIADEYLVRFTSMLDRHMPERFDLHCIVDRDRYLPPQFQRIDARGWPPPRQGMRMTTYKLSLFDADRLPFDEFLYLDLSLVIHRDMTPLLDFASRRTEELVVVKDWFYDAYNTCVMRIRPGGVLSQIPKAYESGSAYDQKHPGDQDFVSAIVKERHWEGSVATFPPETIASYKQARQIAKRNSAEAHRMLQEAVIVKFHGEPKMHQLLDPQYRLKEALKKGVPWHRNAWFWVDELREAWR
jgi:hypothetical protein